jgi:predicted metal-binding protein
VHILIACKLCATLVNSKNQIGDDGAAALASSLQGLTALKELFLR